MLRLTGPALLLAVLGASSLLAGCGPQIGDACITSLDCAQQEQRLFCDGTQPGGYCTVFNCEPDSCYGSSVCVAFNPVLDQACGTLDDVRWPRFERTFCMATCDDDDDCRSGYSCVALRDIRDVAAIPPGERSAAIVDAEPESSKACLPDPSSTPSAPGEPSGDVESAPGICTGAGGAGGSEGEGGSDGAGGAGGSGGEGGAGGAGGSGGEGGAGGAGGSDGEGGAGGTGGSDGEGGAGGAAGSDAAGGAGGG
ncbi:hypothetical protein [Sorangium sp. So ce1078]|uniref:hypothetical protein n=1 Tax=Sorangium sp. So ce1078 TaxID=3133329 RepID=UPI003F60A970